MKGESRNLSLGPALLIAMSAVGCFRGLHVSKIKCDSPESCPSGYFCSMGDAGFGTCLPLSSAGTTGTSGAGGMAGGQGGTNDAGMTGASGTGGPTGGAGPRDFDGGARPDVRTIADVSAGGGVGGSAGTGGGRASNGGEGGTVAGATTAPGGTVVSGGAGAGGTSSTVVATTGPGGAGGTSGPIDAPVDAPSHPGLKALGVACGEGIECESGYCADKICCTAACNGNCETCNANGKCTLAAKGPAPASRTPCGGTGVCAAQCDGVSGAACVFPDSKVTCTEASCKDGVATTASVCDKGSCTPTSTNPCTSNQCGTDGKCAGGCTPGPGTCGAGKYCNDSFVCVPTKLPGASCTSTPKDQCGTGFCVDGVCCESECKDQCMACNSGGSCVRISGDPRNGRIPCTGAGTGSKCAGKCDLTSNTCVYPGSEAVCTPASCSLDESKRIPASTCKDGVCSVVDEISCGLSSYCSSGSCVAQADNGGSCQTNVQCKSNFCTSVGMCCAPGNISCLGSCIDGQSDSTNCGACGVTCAADQTCSGGYCRCSGSSLQCGNTTTCSSTGFENGTSGWVADANTSANALSNVVATSSTSHTGTAALMGRISFDTSNFFYADAMVTLCRSGSAPVTSFSMYVNLNAASAFSSRLVFYSGSTVVSTTSPSALIPNNSWYNLKGNVQGGPVQADKVQVRFQPSTSGSLSGWLYVDDVEWK